MDETSLKELQNLLQIYNNDAGTHFNDQRSDDNLFAAQFADCDTNDSNINMHNDIQDLLNIVRCKLETDVDKKNREQIKDTKEITSPATTNGFWTEILDVMADSNTNTINSNKKLAREHLLSSASMNHLPTTSNFKSDSLKHSTSSMLIPIAKEKGNFCTSEFWITSDTDSDSDLDLKTIDVGTTNDFSVFPLKSTKDITVQMAAKYDTLLQDQQQFKDETQKSINNQMSQLKNVASDYLDKNGSTMATNMKQEFLKDFRDSAQQIRACIEQKYQQNINALQTAFTEDTKKELISFKRELKMKCKSRISNLRTKLISGHSLRMKSLSDLYKSKQHKSINDLRNNLELENETRFADLSSILRKEKDSEIFQLKKHLQISFNKEYENIKNEHTSHLNKYSTKLRNTCKEKCKSIALEFEQKLETNLKCLQLKLENRSEFDFNEFRKIEILKFEEKKLKIENENYLRIERLKNNFQQELEEKYAIKYKNIEVEFKQIRRNITQRNSQKLIAQKIELKNIIIHERVQKFEAKCIQNNIRKMKKYKKNIESDFEAKKKKIKNKHEIGLKNEIKQLQINFQDIINDEKLNEYKNTLHLALVTDIKKEKLNLNQKQKDILDNIENKFRLDKKQSIEKINISSKIELKSEIKNLTKHLESEKRKKIKNVLGKIQNDKILYIAKLKADHQNILNQELIEIEKKYLINEDKNISEIKKEMVEEINLLQRFHMFAKRIQDLKFQVKEYQRILEIKTGMNMSSDQKSRIHMQTNPNVSCILPPYSIQQNDSQPPSVILSQISQHPIQTRIMHTLPSSFVNKNDNLL